LHGFPLLCLKTSGFSLLHSFVLSLTLVLDLGQDKPHHLILVIHQLEPINCSRIGLDVTVTIED
jgi:hypothetical protein